VGGVSYDRIMTDTTPDAARVQLEVYQRMTAAQRLAIAMQLSADTRQLTLAGIRHRHPEYDEARARLALFRVLLGDELFRRVYPDQPLVTP
jgi:hypothetical protein